MGGASLSLLPTALSHCDVYCAMKGSSPFLLVSNKVLKCDHFHKNYCMENFNCEKVKN